ncbi:hypothetical protein GCM10010353_24410 [Streptomyces chryseus]|uniref:AMP-binding enzyme C-terminal domain-containing protein n=1 Tax=Streptomyces chryseus TaxID=68186 RepID=A0ABQ3DMU8_9ACTN|nr:hypothetical protein GCM10010353_24410 [Streptomyces chryseus]GHA99943.1 hypothetical protein GCM10010346_23490 [Streptomyces chryseus]
MAAYCRDRLAHYKIPRRLRIMDSFPMTVSGKVRKVGLRESYRDQGGRPVTVRAACTRAAGGRGRARPPRV